MAKISTYVIDGTIVDGDKVIGSDANNDMITKNYTVGDLVNYFAASIGNNYLVPYFGANDDVDLGSFNLSANSIFIGDLVYLGGSAGNPGEVLTSQGTGSPAIWSTIVGSQDLFSVLNFGNTGNKSITLDNAFGTISLDIDNIYDFANVTIIDKVNSNTSRFLGNELVLQDSALQKDVSYFTDSIVYRDLSTADTVTVKPAAYNNQTFLYPYIGGALVVSVNGVYADMSGNVTIPFSGVTGSGTTTYIPKWSSSTALSDSSIFDNGSAVGIGYLAGAGTRMVVADASGILSTQAIPSGGGGLLHGTASGTDTYTTTISGVTSYVDADAYLIRFTNGNTTGCTLNINGLGARTLYRNNDGALIGGDIISGAEMLCIYNSTLNGFQVIGTAPNTLLGYVTNDDSVTITKGQVVYAFGGQGDRMTVKLANNTGDATSARTVGVVLSTSIAPNQKGLIMMQGLLDGLSILPTATWNDGDPVYLGATAGSITNVKPYAPNHLVYVGTVTTASNGSAGRMYVNIQNGYELDELHNVQAQSPTYKDTLWYDNTVSPAQWKTASISTILGYTPVSPTRTISTTSPLSGGGDLSADRTLSISQSTTSTSGYLSSTDWNTFNGKQNAITLTTTGTSGASTFIGNTLNIPQYQAVLTNPVTGTGTANYVTKWSSSSAISNSVIYDTGTNVIIGSSTDAGYKLDLVGGNTRLGTTTSNTLTIGNGMLFDYSSSRSRIYSNNSIIFTSALTTGSKIITGVIGGNSNTTGSVEFESALGDISQTSGTYIDLSLTGRLLHTSGTSTYNFVNVSPTLQTSVGGTYTGTVRGFYYNPTTVNVFGGTQIAFENTTGDIVHGNLSGVGTRMVTADATGKLGVQAIPSGGTPAGSTGYVQFNTSGAFNADANLFWDNTNKRLGIGTSSPSYPLHILGKAVAIASNSDANGEAFTILQNTATPSPGGSFYIKDNTNTNFLGGFGMSGNNLRFANYTASGNMLLWAGSSDRVSLFGSTGNVAIGTTTDAGYKLDVNGTTRVVTSLQTPQINGNTTSGGTLTLQSTTNATKGKILFGTSAYDEVNNRLGIGTSTPASFIDGVSTATSGIAYGLVHTQTALNASDVGDACLKLDYSISGSGAGTELVTRTLNLYSKNNWITGTVSNMRVFNLGTQTIASSNTTNLDQVYIESVTGGTVTNFRAIHIANSQGTSQGGLVMNQLTGTNRAGVSIGSSTLPSGVWSIYSSTSDKSYHNGNFLIGTTTDAGYKLDVNGSVRFQNSTLTLSGNAFSGNKFVIGNNSTYKNGAATNTPLTIAIGNGSAAGVYGYAFDAANTLGFLLTAGNGTTHTARASMNIANLVNTAGAESGDLTFSTQSGGAALAERMRITSDGKVGIGTTAPTYSLEVKGSSAGVFLGQRSADNTGSANVYLFKTRGTVASPTAVINGDGIGVFNFGGYDGTSIVESSFFGGIVDDTVSASTVPIALRFVTGTTSANKTERMRISSSGGLSYEATNTASGTTGNQTINKISGTVNIAAAGTTVTVTNSLVTTSSIVFATIRTNDATAVIKNVVPAAGSFTINLNAAATAETSIGFFVIN